MHSHGHIYISLVCLSIATYSSCQFWAHNEPVNMPKTIQSPAKCGVCAVIQFLYSEQAMKNVVPRYCPSLWQCSAAYCSLQQIGSWNVIDGKCWITHYHPPGLGSLWFLSLSSYETVVVSLSSYETVVGGQHFGTMSCRPCRELAESTGGWLPGRWYWKVGTTPRKMSTSERRLCREVAGRCG